MLASTAAKAAGGAQIIDDAAVETPGICHLEAWASRTGDGDHLLNLGPGCTLAALPRLEIGFTVQHMRTDGAEDTTLSPGLKFAVADLGHGASVAVAASAVWSTRSEHAETASLVIPVTFQVNPALQASVNVGWEWNRTGVAHRAFYGAQISWTASATMSLAIEGFGYSDGTTGYQAGIRWTPISWLDVDLLYGRLDNVSRHALTLGLTGRY